VIENGLVAVDPAMKRVVKDAERLAAFSTTTVLIEGETGTGKEVLAHHIHTVSPRGNGPFVVLDCSTIPEALLESELFGHEKGAYTGAISSQCGIIEEAKGGTLFLDEVSVLGEKAQSVLMRFIDTHEIHRVGNGALIQIDVRVIAATNQNLSAIVASGTFRRDLYHRLLVAHLWIPPLNERPGDIRPLLEHYLHYWANYHQISHLKITSEAMSELENYSWPGNIRELRNATEWFVIQVNGGVLDKALVHAFILGPEFQRIFCRASTYGGLLRDRQFLMQFVQTWSHTNGHVTNTAKKLGISKGSASRYSRALGLCDSVDGISRSS